MKSVLSDSSLSSRDDFI